MSAPSYTIGQAVFVRTVGPDYAEETVPFKTLDDLIAICTTPRPGCLLETIILQGLDGELPLAVTLTFLAASRGTKPHAPEFETP